jgi:GDP-4-dehydro-6-deoxy-D-mannose reductase
MRALVTGASGFVGRHLVAHLRAEGDDVAACDRSTDGVDIVDREALHALVTRHQPEVVYHLAARTHVGESWADPTAVLRTNVEGTANVLDAARAAGARRVLVVGSAEEYGRVDPADLPLTEDAPLRPTTPYGASKVAASYLALQAHLASGLETVRLRPFNHTGPGQPPRFVVPALAQRIARAEAAGDDEVRVGSLDPVRDLTDVRDVVRAYRLAASHAEAGAVYNVCSGRGITIAEIAETLVGRAHRPLHLVVDPELVRPVEVPRLVGDATRLRAATGWEPQIPLGETLDAVLAEARAAVARSG